jgi:predicted protein tyrosine phosphatase
MKQNKGKAEEKQRFIILLAVILIAIGVVSTLYVTLFRGSEKVEGLLIGETEFSLNKIFDALEVIVVEEYQGVSLAELINKAEIQNPEEKKYIVVAEDGYQKTVEWKSMQEGVLTREKRVVFLDLPKQYWMKNVAKIEVSKNE